MRQWSGVAQELRERQERSGRRWSHPLFLKWLPKVCGWTMGWACDTRPNAVLTTLKRAFDWRTLRGGKTDKPRACVRIPTTTRVGNSKLAGTIEDVSGMRLPQREKGKMLHHRGQERFCHLCFVECETLSFSSTKNRWKNKTSQRENWSENTGTSGEIDLVQCRCVVTAGWRKMDQRILRLGWKVQKEDWKHPKRNCIRFGSIKVAYPVTKIGDFAKHIFREIIWRMWERMDAGELK